MADPSALHWWRLESWAPLRRSSPPRGAARRRNTKNQSRNTKEIPSSKLQSAARASSLELGVELHSWFRRLNLHGNASERVHSHDCNHHEEFNQGERMTNHRGNGVA